MDVMIFFQNFFVFMCCFYMFEGEGFFVDFVVEVWFGCEVLFELFEWCVVVVSVNVCIVFKLLFGQCVMLVMMLVDGMQIKCLGLICLVEKFGVDGSFICYCLIVVFWFWLIIQQCYSQVFQNWLFVDIFEQMLLLYELYVLWCYVVGVEVCMVDFGICMYIVQFCEIDYYFVMCLLVEVGLGFIMVEDDQVYGGYMLVIFVDSM